MRRRNVKSGDPHRGGDPRLRAEGRFLGRLLGEAIRGGGRYRLAALTARELAVCGLLPRLGREGIVALVEHPGIEAPAPGEATWRAFVEYRGELAALLRAGRCPFCAGSLGRLRHVPGALVRLSGEVEVHTACAADVELERIARMAAADAE